jgi:hypothetical protein
MAIDYCVDVPFDAVDFDFRLLLGDVVSGALGEKEEDRFVDVADEELEERVRFKSFLAAVIMKLIPELTIWLTQIRHAKGSAPRLSSRSETVLDDPGELLTKLSYQVLRWLSTVSKKVIDVFDQCFNLFNNNYYPLNWQGL